MRRFLRILGYVLTLVIAGTFIALSFYDLETKQFVDFVALPYVLALGIGTSVNVIFLFIVQAPWRSGIRMRATRESGIILEIFTIFYITVGWHWIVIIGVYALSFGLTVPIVNAIT